jgi:hypothetical protein
MSDIIWRRYRPERCVYVWVNERDEEVSEGDDPPPGYSTALTRSANTAELVKPGPVVQVEPEGEVPRISLTMTLPTDSAERKQVPLFEGAVAYFPAALALLARVSKTGNDKHNPGEPLHHARGKSMDHSDCVVRHLVDIADIVAAIERGKLFNQPGYESVRQQLMAEAGQFFWRAGAYVQELCEKYDNVPLAPNARKTP